MIVDADGLIPIRCRSESHGIRGEAECKRLRLMPFRGSWPPTSLDFPFFPEGSGVRLQSPSDKGYQSRSPVRQGRTYVANRLHGKVFHICIDDVVFCFGQVG